MTLAGPLKICFCDSALCGSHRAAGCLAQATRDDSERRTSHVRGFRFGNYRDGGHAVCSVSSRFSPAVCGQCLQSRHANILCDCGTVGRARGVDVAVALAPRDV